MAYIIREIEKTEEKKITTSEACLYESHIVGSCLRKVGKPTLDKIQNTNIVYLIKGHYAIE